MANICILIGMYGNNSALLTQLYTAAGYRIHGTIDYHALSIKKAGYGEPKQVVDINEHLLTHNASRWFDVCTVEQQASWQGADDSLQPMIDYLHTLSSDALINDPRLSYTLPLWQQALTHTTHQVYAVIPYMHPFTWASQMHQKHQMSTRLALALWVAYTLSAEHHTRSYPRAFIHHRDMLTDWQRTCQPIIAQIAPHGLSTTLTTQIDAYMHMRRYTTPAEPTMSTHIREMDIAQIASDAYDLLQQPTIDAMRITTLQQRLNAELTDPQYRHDVGQFAVVFDDVFLDTEARIHMLHARHADAMHRQHSEFSIKIRELHEEHSKKRTELYEKHGKYIEQQSQMFAETLAKHEQQLAHMRSTFEQEIHHLNAKIATMHTEIEWRAQVTQQQQQTLDRLGWAIRILAITQRITQLWHKS
jgi:hypothetical protein